MKKTLKTTLRQTQSDGERSRTIAKEMTIGEVLQKYPKTAFVFLDYGLYCAGCPMASPETIKEAAKFHGVNLEKFLEDLNKATK
jgi:hybrid cluster-associated redox disulfide protein